MMQEICSIPNRRVLLLTHVKELLEQGFQKLITLWPEAPVGLYSASLKKKQIGDAITIAGIQSCYNKGNTLGFYHVVIIDEVHLLGEKDDGMYRTLLAKLKEINPKLRVIGLSATPWRTKGGLLTNGDNPIFHEIVYSIGIRQLVDMGFLCPLSSKQSKTQADLSKVSTQMGEFNLSEMEAAIDNDELTNKALDEIEIIGADRKSWLFFCSGVKHAHHVCENLIGRGIETACITGKTPSLERDGILAMFKRGERYRALTNNAVLTTGTDIPRVDLLVMLRGTKSPGLMLQIAGRGMRLSPETGKTDCKILDYAGNLERFGFIDQIKAPSLKKKRDHNDAPHKFCPICDLMVAISSKECADCGHIFPLDTMYKHDTRATNARAMSSEAEWYEVDEVTYRDHRGKTIVSGDITTVKPNTLCVTYLSGAKVLREWVCINHEGLARQKARKWLEKRLLIDDGNLEEKYALIGSFQISDAVNKTYELMEPLRIKVRQNGKYEEIVDYEF
jgi:DNA repair protein RadD